MLPFVRYARMQGTFMTAGNLVAYDHRLLYCVGGAGDIFVAGEVYHLSRGRLLLWKSGLPYRFVTWGDMEIVALNFDLSDRQKAHVLPVPPVAEGNFLREKLLEEAQDFPAAGGCLFLEYAEEVYPDLCRILREYEDKQVGYEQVCGGSLLCVLQACRRMAARDGRSMELTQAVLQYIRQNMGGPLSYAEIGAAFHYHPHYLNRLVRAATGMSVHEYLLSCRVEQAIDLLTHTRRPIGEIARALGYADGKSFSRCFSLATGHIPSHYRTKT